MEILKIEEIYQNSFSQVKGEIQKKRGDKKVETPVQAVQCLKQQEYQKERPVIEREVNDERIHKCSVELKAADYTQST